MKRLVARRKVASVLAGCLAVYTQHQALAQATNEASLPEVRVDAGAETATTPVIGYRAKNAVTATKTDTPLAETPQSVTVVTRDQMVDQGATNLQDALTYAAGVRSDAYGIDSRSDSFLVRGSDATIYLDGLQTYSSGWYTSTARPDPYTLERLEVLGRVHCVSSLKGSRRNCTYGCGPPPTSRNCVPRLVIDRVVLGQQR